MMTEADIRKAIYGWNDDTEIGRLLAAVLNGENTEHNEAVVIAARRIRGDYFYGK